MARLRNRSRPAAIASGIAIDRDHAPLRAKRLEDGRRMTPAPERAVAITPVGLNREPGQHFIEKYRRMR